VEVRVSERKQHGQMWLMKQATMYYSGRAQGAAVNVGVGISKQKRKLDLEERNLS